MKEITVRDLKQYSGVSVRGNFNDDIVINISSAGLTSLGNNRLKLNLVRHGGPREISNFHLSLGDVSGLINIYMSEKNSSIVIEDGVKGNFDLRLWRQSTLKIGGKTTSNAAKIVCDNSDFNCGQDCMFSDGVLIQCSDQHAIVDLESNRITNSSRTSIGLGDHVWLGRNVTLMPNISIGSGALIGAGSLVTKDVDINSVAAGVPAGVIKVNTSWSRNPNKIDDYCQSQVLSNKG